MSDEEKTIENLRKNKGVSFAEAGIILNLIEKQQKEIEELQKHKEHEQEYQNGEVFSAKQIYYIEENYIDKDKIREKIKEYETIINQNKLMSIKVRQHGFAQENIIQNIISAKIEILKELLKE